MLGEVSLGMAVGAYLRPKGTVVALAHSAYQARQSDDGKIQPSETLAVKGMPKLMHTELAAYNEPLPFATHPRPCPKVNESA